MKIKKLLSLICSFSILASSLFCCKAEIPEIKIAVFGNNNTENQKVIDCLMNRSNNKDTQFSIYSNYTLNGTAFTFTNQDNTVITRYDQDPSNIYFMSCILGILVVDGDEDSMDPLTNISSHINSYIKSAENKNKNIIIVLKTSPDNSDIDSLRGQLITKLKNAEVESPENRIINLDIDNDESKANLQQHFFNNIGQVQERLKQERK